MDSQKSLIEESLLLYLKTRKLDNNTKNKIYNDFIKQHKQTFEHYNYKLHQTYQTPLEYIKNKKIKKIKTNK